MPSPPATGQAAPNERVKSRSILGVISRACGDFAAHGGLLQNRTANLFMSGETAEFQDPDSYRQSKAVDGLRFEKWDWRKVKA